MMMLLAFQDGLEAVRLVTGSESESRVSDDTFWTFAAWGGVGLAAVLVAVLAIVLARRAAAKRDPAEFAFRALCGKLRLSLRERGVARKAAGFIEAAPVAVLVSDAAYAAAASRMMRGGCSEGDRRTLLALGGRLGVKLNGLRA